MAYDDDDRDDSRSSRGSGGRGGSGGRQRGGERRYQRRFCSFCVDKVDDIDYKQIAVLQPYLTNSGKIFSRRRTGTCARHQRGLAQAIKRARFLALLPHTSEHIRQSGMGSDS
ncbi:MAG: 30S ribosomal protein S18 [Caldilineales bacterium]|nr:30S ribosomal protein S18 [Caldilineales bacterium]